MHQRFITVNLVWESPASTAKAAAISAQIETASSLSESVKRDSLEFILALFVDLTGKPCAKLVPAQAVEQLEAKGVGFAGYAVGAIGQQPSDPDIMAMPDPASYTLPFIQSGLALVHCDPWVEGKPWPYAPRVILKQALATAAEHGVSLCVGAEVEYFLLKRDKDGVLDTADSRDTASQPCYDARGVTRMYDP